MRLEMLNDGQAIRVIKGALQQHIRQHRAITAENLGHLPHDIFARLAGTMLQMAQENVPVDHVQVEELNALREKWANNKHTINYWMQRARNAEARLTELGEKLPEPPKVKPPKEPTTAGEVHV